MPRENLSEWNGVPRDTIVWHPTVDPDLCMGCGVCVLGCGPKVYRFDYTKNKSVVAEPLKCKVGCVTCANTCPTHAIGFPPLNTVHKIMKDAKVIQHSRKEIEERREEFSV